ncbi:MAG: YdeI/OmpD-associated family protein [Candidatus Acidiferrales bacterium]
MRCHPEPPCGEGSAFVFFTLCLDVDSPGDFLKLLANNKKAEALFKSLNKANTYAIVWRLQTASHSRE